MNGANTPADTQIAVEDLVKKFGKFVAVDKVTDALHRRDVFSCRGFLHRRFNFVNKR